MVRQALAVVSAGVGVYPAVVVISFGVLSGRAFLLFRSGENRRREMESYSRPHGLIFYVNGKKIVDENPDPEWTLLFYLRNKLRLCGTKLACGEGGCGACTVMVSKFDVKTGSPRHFPLNACLAPLCSMHGTAVTTIEGIGSTKTILHPVQERIAKAHGSQCGFCTPGIVMSMYTLLRNMPLPSLDDMDTAFQGNLCRCTGYRSIIDGFQTFADDWATTQNCNALCGMGQTCCRLSGSNHKEEILFDINEFTPYDASQEPIFPPLLSQSRVYDSQDLLFKSDKVKWYRPISLQDLLEIKRVYPGAKLVVGNTEVGVETKFRYLEYPVLVHVASIHELTQCSVQTDGVLIGASTTLEDLEEFLRVQVQSLSKSKTGVFKAILDILPYFGGKQIRCVASVGGNIMTGSPVSDLNPIFMASNSKLTLKNKAGERVITMDENFFTSYRTTVALPDEVLISVKIPFTKGLQFFNAYKQARRRDDDIATVTGAINLELDSNVVIQNIRLAFGGMAPTTVLALKTENELRGLDWNENTLEKAFKLLMDDLPLSPSAPGGMTQYRRALTLSFLFRTFIKVNKQLMTYFDKVNVMGKDLSAIEGFHYKIPKSAQFFQIAPISQSSSDPIGRPIVHTSAYKHATGEAVFVDDMPTFEKELHLSLLFSTKAHAKIVRIDPKRAIAMDGVEAFLSANDMPQKHNLFGPMRHDDEIFALNKVTCQGQVIGAVLAKTQAIAQKAVKKIVVEYKEQTPIVITLEDAIKHKTYLCPPKVIENGNVDEALASAPHVLEGECRIGYQEHFYMEPQTAIAVPKGEDDEMEVYCACQHPSELAAVAARVLGIPQNKIKTKVKRIGGGFGGKETRPMIYVLPVVIAAYIYQRPVRIVLDRDEDMMSTGGRHPFLMKYKVGFDDEGKLLAYDVTMYANAGCSTDSSPAVLERAMIHVGNSYNIPNVRVTGHLCRTNLPSNTAFRGFGAPQAMFCSETMIRDVAEYLKKDAYDICFLNLYEEGDKTYYNQVLEHCTLRRCWQECIKKSGFELGKIQVDIFNEENRWKKRGVSIVPTTFGIGFSAPFMNQAGALVIVYTDGSVLISHAGTEMGQGLHTKMIQVASRTLGIPSSRIHISETATDKVPNTTQTAGSTSSDLNGMAIMNACDIIKKRLEPYKANDPQGKWDDWVSKAYYDRVSLSATGFYKTPDIGYDWKTNSGQMFNYFSFGVAATEVEIDCLTGDHQVLRSDIVMDLGDSLNPAVDIGQIEGAFMQGYGLFVMEEMLYSPKGYMISRGPGTYKIPGFSDIPLEFNVSLLTGAPNPRAVYSSKAIGEPPLFLASTALFAIREAIKAARKDAGITTPFRLNAPATPAKIRMGCCDKITENFPEPDPDSYTPWNVTL